MTELKKPLFECKGEAKRQPDGTIEIHFTLRDGSVRVFPGPPGVVFENLPIAFSAYQPEGSDDIRFR